MRVVQRGRGLSDDLPDLIEGKLGLALQPCLKRLPFDQRHDEVVQSVGVAGIEDRQDSGVVQLAEQPDLAQKPRGSNDRTEMLLQNLEGDGTVLGGVPTAVDKGHAAATDLVRHLIARKDRALQLLARLVGVVAQAPSVDGIWSAGPIHGRLGGSGRLSRCE